MKRPRKEFEDPQMSDFEASDSDDEYEENEKILLDRARKRGRDSAEESEEEVFAIQSDNESKDDMQSEDDIQSEDDELPSSKAWGRKRKTYYNTDYVDEDFGGFQGKDAEAAEYEEKEARAIQERLAKEIDENDYMLDFMPQPSTDKDKPEEKIETDLTNLSKREKLALFAKDSPEFAAIVADFEAKQNELNTKLEPILQLIKNGVLPPCPASGYIRTKHSLILNYCTNIAFYVMLKAKRVNIQAHPVVQRLFQYRQLLKKLEPLDKQILPQIDKILKLVEKGEKIPVNFKDTSISSELPEFLSDYEVDSEGPSEDGKDVEMEQEQDETQEEQENVEGEENSRRAITYQIAKNKGLTPRRKKEQRNPRVKHREKYRKAKIRRKGQVREARKELRKYDGEISGIKIGVVKSVKLK